MNIAIIGSGGREHALCDAIAKSKYAKKVFCVNYDGNLGGNIDESVSIYIEQIWVEIKQNVSLWMRS